MDSQYDEQLKFLDQQVIPIKYKRKPDTPVMVQFDSKVFVNNIGPPKNSSTIDNIKLRSKSKSPTNIIEKRKWFSERRVNSNIQDQTFGSKFGPSNYSFGVEKEYQPKISDFNSLNQNDKPKLKKKIKNNKSQQNVKFSKI